MPPPSSARLRFLGATGTVTGSRYLLEAGQQRVLVYCGLLRWMAAGPAPAMTYLTHGEPEAAETLRRRLWNELDRRPGFPSTWNPSVLITRHDTGARGMPPDGTRQSMVVGCSNRACALGP